MYFTRYFGRLKFHRTYIYYALAHGLSSLVIPLASQFLVNNLALAGIWANTVSFLTILAVILAMVQIFRHTQVILVEFLQREIFIHEIRKWRHLKDTRFSHYYFEIYTMLKSFAKSYTDFIDIILVAFFGLCTIIIFHPAFLVLPLLMGLTIYSIRRSFQEAYETSIKESDEKYNIYNVIASGQHPTTKITYDYLHARDKHFGYIRSASLKISMLYAFCIFYILAVGAYLIHIDQLSLGQLVAAELIVAGILSSLSKLPSSLESLYDFETSHYKIEKALRSANEAH